MSEQSNDKKVDEQAKAQNLFARWRKEETLYKEDEKEEQKAANTDNSEEEKNSIPLINMRDWNINVSVFFCERILVK